MKKVLNFIEIGIIIFVIYSIHYFYFPQYSNHRSFEDNILIRTILDTGIVLLLISRTVLILKSINTPWHEYGKIKKIEYTLFILFLLCAIPDIRIWIYWKFFADIYGVWILLYFSPILLWLVEILARKRK